MITNKIIQFNYYLYFNNLKMLSMASTNDHLYSLYLYGLHFFLQQTKSVIRSGIVRVKIIYRRIKTFEDNIRIIFWRGRSGRMAERTKASVATRTSACSIPRLRAAFFFGQVTVSVEQVLLYPSRAWQIPTGAH